MKHFVFFLIIGFSFFSFTQGLLTPEILWKLNRVSGGTVSPDGNYLLYSQRSFDMAANKGNTDLFVIDLKNNQSKQITATPFSEMEAQWGKNNTIWFASAEKNGLQIWKMKHDGSSKIQCSNFTDIEFEGFKLSPDESMVLTIEALKLKPTITDKYADLPKANARVEDDLMYRHWDHFDDYKRRHLMLHRINSPETSEIIQVLGIDILQGEMYDGIVPPFGGSDQFCFSNDSKKVLYTSKKMVGKEFAQSTNTAIYAYSISSKETVNLTAAYKGYDNNPAFSTSGELAWLSMARDGFEADKNDIILRNLAGIDKNLTKDLDLTVTDFAWHPSGKMIYFLAATKGTVHIFEMDVASGKIRQVTTGQHDYVSISLFGDKVYSGRQSMVAPTDLYAISIKKNKIEQLTEANESILKNLQLPKVEERWMKQPMVKKCSFGWFFHRILILLKNTRRLCIVKVARKVRLVNFSPTAGT